MRGWSPRMMVAQHAEARSEPIDDGGGAGEGSRQNFGSVIAQGNKNSEVRIKGRGVGSYIRPTVATELR
jgi:hypothetical protein